jgi:hypothetical protein
MKTSGESQEKLEEPHAIEDDDVECSLKHYKLR